jgi:hypothetical protein
LPDKLPIAFTEEFTKDNQKQTQWKAFIKKSRLDTAGNELDSVISCAAEFLVPIIEAVRENKPFELFWLKTGHWSKKK